MDVQGTEKAGETRNSLNVCCILFYSTTFRLYYQDVHVVHYHKCFDDSFSFLSVQVQWVDLNKLRDGFI